MYKIVYSFPNQLFPVSYACGMGIVAFMSYHVMKLSRGDMILGDAVQLSKGYNATKLLQEIPDNFLLLCHWLLVICN